MKVLRCVFVFVFVSCVMLNACRRNSNVSETANQVVFSAETANTAGTAPVSVWEILAVVGTGKNPLWFELTNTGPKVISFPSDASLAGFLPWQHSRFCAGMIASGTDLIMAINKTGFYVIRKEDGNFLENKSAKDSYAYLFGITDSGWEPYTISSVFVHETKPAAFLYRDDFFSPVSGTPPDRPVMILSEDQKFPVGLRFTPLDTFPGNEEWEINSLKFGNDNFWHYRLVQRNNSQPDTLYYRTNDLSAIGERTGPEDYRNSSSPESLNNAPEYFNLLADAVSSLRQIPLLSVISPEFNRTRHFSASISGENDFSTFPGYYWSDENAAFGFVFAPNGKGFAMRKTNDALDAVVFPVNLPELPRNFVYTNAGLTGNILVVSWEEQMDYSVGAAGFMMLNALDYGLFGN